MAAACTNDAVTPCIPCANASAANGQPYALYSFATTGAILVGECLPAVDFINAVDYFSGPPPSLSTTDGYLLLRQGGPGWYVAENKLITCPAGYYCPLNLTSGYYDHAVPCLSSWNQFCAENMIQPKTCSGFFNCQGAKIRAGPGGIPLFVSLIVLSIVFMIVQCWRSQQMRKRAMLLSALHRDDDVASHFGDEVKNATCGSVRAILPASIEFEGVGLRLRGAKKSTPPILEGVTGYFPPRSLVALMGPSGCGKTTFMNVLLGRTPYGHAVGRVSVNGDSDNPLLKRKGIVGFVPQVHHRSPLPAKRRARPPHTLAPHARPTHHRATRACDGILPTPVLPECRLARPMRRTTSCTPT